MLWLDAKHRYRIVRDDSGDHVVPWRVDVRAWPGEAHETIESLLVGRFLADEIRRFEIEEWGEEPFEACDDDSAGLVAAYASLTDAQGQFLADEFNSVSDPFVYLYAFALHPDFAECKLSIIDGFCRLFANQAVILTGTWVNWTSQAEFEAVGFKVWEPVEGRRGALGHLRGKVLDVGGDLSTLMVRDNTIATSIKVADYPISCPLATKEHARWVREKVSRDRFGL